VDQSAAETLALGIHCGTISNRDAGPWYSLWPNQHLRHRPLVFTADHSAAGAKPSVFTSDQSTAGTHDLQLTNLQQGQRPTVFTEDQSAVETQALGICCRPISSRDTNVKPFW